MTITHTIKEQQEVAKHILQKLEIIDPCCILAGGAPRDWDLGVPANDLDFYLFLGHNSMSWTMEHQLKSIGFCAVRQIGRDSKDSDIYKSNPNIVRVYETHIQGVKVQFIVCSKPTFGIVETFPFNMCQAWWKGDKIHTSKAFQIGKKLGILYKCGETYAEQDRYIEKMKTRFNCEKFSGYTYVTTKEKFLDAILNKTKED